MHANLLLLLLSLLLNSAVVAQQDADQDQLEVPSAENAEPEQITIPDEPPAPFQEFDPSEEISEDFSVPFPVDI